MSRQLEKMYKDIFTGKGVIPCKPVPGFNPNGKFYKMNPELGKGYCWVYQCNPYVTITIMVYFMLSPYLVKNARK